MDPEKFLQLPVTIRKEVYFHLDGAFTNIHQRTNSILNKHNLLNLSTFLPKPTRTEKQKKLLKRLYPIYSPYLSIFEYDPTGIDQWLKYALWLRYDSIILDCIRVNHLYEGNILGPMDWITLDDKLQLGYFDELCLLQVWYTYKEYATWIIEGGHDDNLITETEYLSINTECLSPKMIKETLTTMKEKKVLPLIYYAFLSQIQQENDSEDDEFEARKIDYDTSDNNDELSSKTRNSTPRESRKGKEYNLQDPLLITFMGQLEQMKNLKKISVRGDIIYESSINSHGIRERGRGIKHLVKRKIVSLELFQVHDLTKSGVADFTKWTNLRELRINQLENADLNQLVLPPTCKLLIINNSFKITWWRVMAQIEGILTPGHRFITECYKGATNVQCREAEKCDHRKLVTLDPDSIPADVMFDCEKLASLEIFCGTELYRTQRYF